MRSVKVVLSTLLLLAVGQTCAQLRANPRDDAGNDETQALERVLVEDDFRPLSCNAGLSSAPCNSWTSRFSGAMSHTNEIVIPCGECVTMDYSGALNLLRGLDIQGKLVFPDGAKVTLKTPYVRVQGELHMFSSKAPNGQEQVKFVIDGTDQTVTSFTPADSNRNACGGFACTAGKKPIVVAGGKLVIEALPADFPAWVNLYDVIAANVPGEDRSRALVLSNTVQGKWGVGAQVLVTSHTREWNEEQVRTITNIYDHSEAGYVVVELDTPIWRPTTLKDSQDFATEVALLARNIVFEGAADDSNSSHGAHLIIMNTPNVVQKLEGVELRNFGQQGNLGRYPIHFHLCEGVSGSVVSKNLVRQSNQRCVVVHGTNDLVVSENVAYDTAGHCFMTEDGIEQGNEFLYNLGALTRSVDRKIPDDGTNGDETDDEPSTFWMTNPSNTWIGNVAAGSEDTGFWFELIKRGPREDMYPDLVPKYEPLGRFENNIVHSNGHRGFRTYPSGYEPPMGATFVGLRSYRNYGDGVFFHNSKNLTLVGGTFADNREQLDFDRAEHITLRDSRVIGISPQYQSLMDRQDAGSPCNGARVIGIQLHTFTRDHEAVGAVIENVQFSGFANTGCRKSVGIDFDDEVRSGAFDYFTVMSDISQEDGSIPVNMCDAGSTGVNDIYLTDLGGYSSTTTRNVGGSASVISDGSPILNFVPQELCTSYPAQCLSYCENTCLRTVTYAVDPASTENFRLRVCSSDNPGRCSESEEAYWYRDYGDEFDTLEYNTRAERPRYFTATLPKGSYRAEFLDTNGNVVWPSFVTERYEKAMCPNALEEGAVVVTVPQVGDSECSNLIRNGNAEASGVDHTHWLHRRGGITLRPGQGIGGSNALATIKDVSTRFDSVAQYLDTRCLDMAVGNQYEINAWIKLVRSSGEIDICDPENDKCPQVGLYGQASDGSYWDEQPFATVVPYIRDGDYQLVQGLLDVTEEIASASSVLFYIRRNVRSRTMFVDNVSVRHVGAFVPQPGGSDGGFTGTDGDGGSGGDVVDDGSGGDGGFGGDNGDFGFDEDDGSSEDIPVYGGPDENDSNGGSWTRPGGSGGGGGGDMTGTASGMCGNFVSNGDFSTGKMRSWYDSDGNDLSLVSPGYRGVSDLALSSMEGRMVHELESNDFEFGMNYIASGRFRLLDASGNPMRCEDDFCPRMVLSLTDLGEDSMQTVAKILGVKRSANWGILLGGFTADESHVGAESIKVKFINVPYGSTLIVDEIFIGLSDSACDTPAFAFTSSNSASPSSWAVSMVTYVLIAVGAIASLL